MNGISFIKAQGGLGRPIAGDDQVSGLLIYSSTLPTGFGSAHEKVIYSLSDAETLGIAASSTDWGRLHYHISEFYRIQPNAELWLGIYAVPAGLYDFTEITTLQNTSGGRIRQVGVYAPLVDFTTAFSITVSSVSHAFSNSAQITALQYVATTNYNNNKPLVILYAPNVPAATAFSALLDLTTLTADSVGVVIGQDGGGAGNTLYNATDPSVTCLGAILGAISLAKVSENIGWVAKFNFSNGLELETLAFSNGKTYNTQLDSDLSALDAKGYIFLRKHIGISGSYANDDHTAVADTSDYAYIENQRTVQKAIRNIRISILPELSGPLTLKADGSLNAATARHFESLCQQALDPMQNNSELSAYKVNVNPAQNVLSTSQLQIGVLLVPVGTARQIEVNIGFTISIN